MSRCPTMTDLTKQGHWRTKIAMAKLAELDHQATGQYQPRRRMPSVFLSSLVAILSARPAPKPIPKRRVQRVVEVESYGCSLCQHPAVKTVAVLALLLFIFSVVAPAWHGQDFVQDHFAHHGGGYD